MKYMWGFRKYGHIGIALFQKYNQSFYVRIDQEHCFQIEEHVNFISVTFNDMMEWDIAGIHSKCLSLN